MKTNTKFNFSFTKPYIYKTW